MLNKTVCLLFGFACLLKISIAQDYVDPSVSTTGAAPNYPDYGHTESGVPLAATPEATPAVEPPTEPAVPPPENPDYGEPPATPAPTTPTTTPATNNGVDSGLQPNYEDNFDVVTQTPVVVNPPTRRQQQTPPPTVCNQCNRVPNTIINWYLMTPKKSVRHVAAVRKQVARPRQVFARTQLPWERYFGYSGQVTRRRPVVKYRASRRRSVGQVVRYFWRM